MIHPFAASRELFPILKHKVQLSSCSQSALSIPVAQALQDYLEVWQRQGMDWVGWMQAVEEAKAEFAQLIGADPQDVAVAGSVSDAASHIASALSYTAERRRIVVGECDFPSMGHVWLAQQPRGAEVHFVPAAGGHCTPASHYQACVDERTRLISVSHVAYDTGFIQDLGAIQRLAQSHGALVFVDAYQSAGALDIDVQRDGIDILAAGAQKFLLGCPGIAFLYVRPGLAAQLQPGNTGWFGRQNPFAFDIRKLDFPANASRFNTGTPPMVNAFAARAALRLLNSLERGAVQDHLLHLARLAREESQHLGLTLALPLQAPTLTTALRVGDAAACEKRLAEQGYLTSARRDILRIAPHFYNTEADVLGAVRALAALRNTEG